MNPAPHAPYVPQVGRFLPYEVTGPYWAASAARRRIGRGLGWISRPVGRKATSEMAEPEPPGKS